MRLGAVRSALETAGGVKEEPERSSVCVGAGMPERTHGRRTSGIFYQPYVKESNGRTVVFLSYRIFSTFIPRGALPLHTPRIRDMWEQSCCGRLQGARYLVCQQRWWLHLLLHRFHGWLQPACTVRVPG